MKWCSSVSAVATSSQSGTPRNAASSIVAKPECYAVTGRLNLAYPPKPGAGETSEDDPMITVANPFKSVCSLHDQR